MSLVTLVAELTPEIEALIASGEASLPHVASRVGNQFGKYAKIVSIQNGAPNMPGMRSLPSSMLVGLQAANLIVSVAGFATVLIKLNALDRKLDQMVSELRGIGQDVGWIRGVLDAELLARLRSAAQQLSLPIFNDRAQRLTVLSNLIDVGEQLHARRELLLTRREALAQAELFGVYSDYLATCIRLQLSTAWQLDSPDSALMLGLRWAERLDTAADQFAAPIKLGTRSVRALATYATLPADKLDHAGVTHTGLRRVAAAVAKQVDQIETAMAHGVLPANVAALEAAHPDETILIVLDGGKPTSRRRRKV